MCNVITDGPQLKNALIKVSAKSKWKYKSFYLKTKRKALTFWEFDTWTIWQCAREHHQVILLVELFL